MEALAGLHSRVGGVRPRLLSTRNRSGRITMLPNKPIPKVVWSSFTPFAGGLGSHTLRADDRTGGGQLMPSLQGLLGRMRGVDMTCGRWPRLALIDAEMRLLPVSGGFGPSCRYPIPDVTEIPVTLNRPRSPSDRYPE